ncbi:ABC-F family ATP-binding cassette domain-containing protein [soil metagenome]
MLVQAAGLTYAHGGNEVFGGVDFEIGPGERIALVGENGAGKSTLFRLIARQITPDSGELTFRRNTIVGMLQQEPHFAPGVSIIDAVKQASAAASQIAIRMRELETRMQEADGDEFDAVLEEYARCQEEFEALGGYGADSRAEEVLTGLGFGEERWGQTVSSLSGGEKKLVGLAQLLLQDVDILLLDEPDNHLDFSAKDWLQSFIKAHRGAVGIISHDRYFLDQAVNRLFELEDGGIFAYPTAYSGFLVAKQERLEREAALRELREREFKQLKRSAEQLTEWARMNPKFAKRAGNKRRMLEIERTELESKPRPILERRRIDVDFQTSRGGRIVLDIKGVAKSFETRHLLLPFDVMIEHGECVGIVGDNGSGKTTLFRMIAGFEEPTAGVIRMGPSIRMGYYSQEQETLDPNKTPLDIVRSVKALSEPEALGFLSTLMFDRIDSTNAVRNLSGGERSRLQIALLMLQEANFLLLDEPTNNLDIPSCEELEDALLNFEGTIVTISHDRYFLDKLATRIIELDNGAVREYRGDFSYFNRERGNGSVLTQTASR